MGAAGGSEKLGRELVGELLDGVRLVAVGDEEGVAGLHDDQVVDAEQGDVAALAGVEDDVVLGIDLGDRGVDSVVVADFFEVVRDGEPGIRRPPLRGTRTHL